MRARPVKRETRTSTEVLPCSGPKTKPSIELAQLQLAQWAKREGLPDGKQQPDQLPPDARLWYELLRQSLEGIHLDTVPSLPRGDLAAPTGIKLTERRFAQFQRWFEREILIDLERLVRDRGCLPIRAHRVSDRRGGDATVSEAKYFLTFAPFASWRATDGAPEAPASGDGVAQPVAGQPSSLPPEAPVPADERTTKPTSRSEGEEAAEAVNRNSEGADAATKQSSAPPPPDPAEPKSDCSPSNPTAPSAVDIALVYALARRQPDGGHGGWTVAAVMVAVAVTLAVVEPQTDGIGPSLVALISSVSDVLTGRWHVIF